MKCRLWWPSDLSKPSVNYSLLFGWFLPSSGSSFDVVVAFCCDDMGIISSGHGGLDLEEILKGVNETMPSFLQRKCKFSILGHCEADFCDNFELTSFQNGVTNSRICTRAPGLHSCVNNCERWSCGCLKHEWKLKQSGLLALEDFWIKLVLGHSDNAEGRVSIIPKVDHLHFKDEIASHFDLHVIFYEVPAFGHQHYSLYIPSSSNTRPPYCMKPKWFESLHQQAALTDLEYVIQAVNSVQSTRMLFIRHSQAESSFLVVISLKFTTFAWKVFALSVASLSTMIYIFLWSSRTIFCWLSFMYIDKLFAKVMNNTSKNVHYRCSQFLHWPIFLQDRISRDYSCVEFAEKAEFNKHSVWSSLVVDIILGNLFGILLWVMADPLCLGVSYFASDFTNNWLRSGCIWMMGNPAGFKLNTELAGVLGMISLNAIQIWSTLAIFMAALVVPFTKGLALFGVFFGLTSAAALVIDVISLAKMHVSTLHAFFSLIYSTQIQIVAALWRLFRGRKYNPLRHRLDSYEYTIDQHVVGSLLFTPILLLLPTISAFYIFFTISHIALIALYIVVEASISVFHSTPYAKIFLWLKRIQRFPSGVWFDVQETALQNNCSILFSHLRSNFLSFGKLISPHYTSFSSSYSKSCVLPIAHALLTGTSIPSTPGPVFPMELQWIAIPWKEYWCLCRDSVYACRHKTPSLLH